MSGPRSAQRGLRIPLLWKLLTVHAVVLALVLVAVWLSLEFQAADYFMTLMKKFDVDAPEVNAMFLDANRASLLRVAAVATVFVALLCWWTTRRILAPLRATQAATERIAQGDYSCRVGVRSHDEVGDLARAFDQMAAALAHLERLRLSMVVDVAHELRTPLNNLRGYLEALQDGLVEPTREVYDTLHAELLRLVRLTEDLLAAARGGERRHDDRVAVDVGAVLRKAFDLFGPRLEHRRVELRTAELQAGFDAGALTVAADPDQLDQVFTNLLQNGLQFAPEGTWIEVCARAEQQVVRVEFANPGAPIPAADLPFVFEPYYRADKSRSRVTGGAGIGLAIVRALVEAHGGTVGVTSTPAETRVWVELPRRSDRAGADEDLEAIAEFEAEGALARRHGGRLQEEA